MLSGIDNTESNRRDWRELLYTAPDLGKYISGAIMFEETLYQSCADGKPFVDVLRDQGIMPGIKVDGGLEASVLFCMLATLFSFLWKPGQEETCMESILVVYSAVVSHDFARFPEYCAVAHWKSLLTGQQG